MPESRRGAPWLRWTATGVSAIVFYSNVLAPPLAQANFWEERRKAVQEVRESRGRVGSVNTLALPAPPSPAILVGEHTCAPPLARSTVASPHHALPLSSWTAASTFAPSTLLPGSATEALGSHLLGPPYSSNAFTRQAAYAPLLQALPLQYGTIRHLWVPPGAQPTKTVILMQDAHGNPEAQSNLGKAIQALIDQKAIGLVALEGTWEPIDLTPFRTFPHQDTIQKVADYLLREDKISGPIHTAFTSPNPIPSFVGVDHPQHYQANVKAYRQAAPLQQPLKDRWITLDRQLAEAKRVTFSPALSAFDAHIQGYRQGRIPLGQHLPFLTQRHASSTLHEGGETLLSCPSPLAGEGVRRTGEGNQRRGKLPPPHRPAPLPAVATFLAALALERSLNFAQVERERTQLLEALTRTLTEDQRSALVQRSLAFRLGQLGHAELYRSLQELCTQQGIDVKRYPAMTAYLHYVFLSDRIDAEQLFKEIAQLEQIGYDRLATTPEEQALIAQSKRLYLIGKLLDFSLTPEEWAAYKTLKDRHPLSSRGGLPKDSTGRTDVGISSRRSRGWSRRPLLRNAKESLLTMTGNERLLATTPRELAPFEAFYHEAEARNAALVTNLLAKMENPGSDPNSLPFPLRGRGVAGATNRSAEPATGGRSGASTPRPPSAARGGEGVPQVAVLVAGGFHTPGLQTLLRDRQIAYVTFVPKITQVDDASGTKSLSAFAQEKTPLERLFTGEKLFLARDPVPASAVHLGEILTIVLTQWPQKLGRWTLTTYKATRKTVRSRLKGELPSGAVGVNATVTLDDSGAIDQVTTTLQHRWDQWFRYMVATQFAAFLKNKAVRGFIPAIRQIQVLYADRRPPGQGDLVLSAVLPPLPWEVFAVLGGVEGIFVFWVLWRLVVRLKSSKPHKPGTKLGRPVSEDKVVLPPLPPKQPFLLKPAEIPQGQDILRYIKDHRVDPFQLVEEKFQEGSNVVTLGEMHGSRTEEQFAVDLVPRLRQRVGLTHLAVEIEQTHQEDLDYLRDQWRQSDDWQWASFLRNSPHVLDALRQSNERHKNSRVSPHLDDILPIEGREKQWEAWVEDSTPPEIRELKELLDIRAVEIEYFDLLGAAFDHEVQVVAIDTHRREEHRDENMARNVQAIFQRDPNAKVLVYVGNAHAEKSDYVNPYGQKKPSLGAILKGDPNLHTYTVLQYDVSALMFPTRGTLIEALSFGLSQVQQTFALPHLDQSPLADLSVHPPSSPLYGHPAFRLGNVADGLIVHEESLSSRRRVKRDTYGIAMGLTGLLCSTLGTFLQAHKTRLTGLLEDPATGITKVLGTGYEWAHEHLVSLALHAAHKAGVDNYEAPVEGARIADQVEGKAQGLLFFGGEMWAWGFLAMIPLLLVLGVVYRQKLRAAYDWIVGYHRRLKESRERLGWDPAKPIWASPMIRPLLVVLATYGLLYGALLLGYKRQSVWIILVGSSLALAVILWSLVNHLRAMVKDWGELSLLRRGLEEAVKPRPGESKTVPVVTWHEAGVVNVGGRPRIAVRRSGRGGEPTVLSEEESYDVWSELARLRVSRAEFLEHNLMWLSDYGLSNTQLEVAVNADGSLHTRAQRVVVRITATALPAREILDAYVPLALALESTLLGFGPADKRRHAYLFWDHPRRALEIFIEEYVNRMTAMSGTKDTPDVRRKALQRVTTILQQTQEIARDYPYTSLSFVTGLPLEECQKILEKFRTVLAERLPVLKKESYSPEDELEPPSALVVEVQNLDPRPADPWDEATSTRKSQQLRNDLQRHLDLPVMSVSPYQGIGFSWGTQQIGHEECGTVVRDENGTEVAIPIYVRVGYLFYMDAHIWQHLEGPVRQELARNVILLDNLRESSLLDRGLRSATLATISTTLHTKMEGVRAIDAGSREGIAALTAWRGGASSLWLIDYDVEALRNARRHLKANGLQENRDFFLLHGDLTDRTAMERRMTEAQRWAVAAGKRETKTAIISDIGPWALLPGNNDRYTATNHTTMGLIPLVEETTGSRVVCYIGAGYPKKGPSEEISPADEIYLPELPNDIRYIKEELGFKVFPHMTEVETVHGWAVAWAAERTAEPVPDTTGPKNASVGTEQSPAASNTRPESTEPSRRGRMPRVLAMGVLLVVGLSGWVWAALAIPLGFSDLAMSIGQYPTVLASTPPAERFLPMFHEETDMDRAAPTAGLGASALEWKIETILLNFVNMGDGPFASGMLQSLTSVLKARPTVHLQILIEEGQETTQSAIRKYLRYHLPCEIPTDQETIQSAIRKYVRQAGVDDGRLSFIEGPFQGAVYWYHYLRDFFVFAEPNLMIAPKSFRQYHLSEDLHRIADALGLRVVQSDLKFEGGNILCTTELVFVGRQTLVNNITGPATPEALEAVKQRFEELFGRLVIVVGEEDQDQQVSILYHLDNFLTPIGNRAVLLADPLLGARLLETTPQIEFDRAHEHLYAERRKLVAAGLLNPVFTNDPNESHADHNDVYGFVHLKSAKSYGASNMDYSKQLQVRLQSIEKGLRKQGINVAGYLPFVYVAAQRRKHSYNNVLLEDYWEHSRRIRTVDLPTIGIESLDNHAAAVFRKHGFAVRFITGGYELTGRQEGEWRCVTNEIRKVLKAPATTADRIRNKTVALHSANGMIVDLTLSRVVVWLREIMRWLPIVLTVTAFAAMGYLLLRLVRSLWRISQRGLIPLSPLLRKDFHDYLKAQGMTNPELLRLIGQGLMIYRGEDLWRIVQSIERLRPQPEEESIARDPWKRLRQDLGQLPHYEVACRRAGLSYGQGINLLQTLLRFPMGSLVTEFYSIEKLTETLELIGEKQLPLAGHLDSLKGLISLGNNYGLTRGYLDALQVALAVGLNLEQGCRLIATKLPEADGSLSGYVLPVFMQALKGFLFTNVDSDLIVRLMDLAGGRRPYVDNKYRELMQALYLSVARQGKTPAEFVRECITDIEAKGEFQHATALSIQKVKPYFQGVEGPLVRVLLPYRLKKSWEEGIADLTRLTTLWYEAGDVNMETPFIFDSETETWYSLGGRGDPSIGRIRHYGVFPDVSTLSREPIYVHIHPSAYESFISAPLGRVLTYPTLREKITNFLQAMPSAADWIVLHDLLQEVTQPIRLRAYIVHPIGLTEVLFPSEVVRIQEVAAEFRHLKDEVLLQFDARRYIQRFGEREEDFVFAQRLTAEVNRRLPDGFKIRLHRLGQPLSILRGVTMDWATGWIGLGTVSAVLYGLLFVFGAFLTTWLAGKYGELLFSTLQRRGQAWKGRKTADHRAKVLAGTLLAALGAQAVSGADINMVLGPGLSREIESLNVGGAGLLALSAIEEEQLIEALKAQLKGRVAERQISVWEAQRLVLELATLGLAVRLEAIEHLPGKMVALPLEGGSPEQIQRDVAYIHQLLRVLPDRQPLLLMVNETDKRAFEQVLTALQKRYPGRNISLWTQDGGFFTGGGGERRLRLKQLEVSLSNPTVLAQIPLEQLMVAIPEHVTIDASGIGPDSPLHQVNVLYLKTLDHLLQAVVLRVSDLETLDRITRSILKKQA